MISEVREIVKKGTPENDYRLHTSKVVKYSKILAKEYHADLELVEVAALLHDFGGAKRGWKNHEKKGAIEAKRILKKLNYQKKKISEVAACILTHRTRSKKLPKTLEAWIIRDADNLAHFDGVKWVLNVGIYRNKEDVKKAKEWVLEKLKRDYKVIHFKESRIIAKEMYAKAKKTIDSFK